MTDNVVMFPGTEKQSENRVKPEDLLEAAKDKYADLIMVGRTKNTNRYECVSTMEMSETLYHMVRIQHRLNAHLDGLKAD